jgi:hypothetical protein
MVVRETSSEERPSLGPYCSLNSLLRALPWVGSPMSGTLGMAESNDMEPPVALLSINTRYLSSSRELFALYDLLYHHLLARATFLLLQTLAQSSSGAAQLHVLNLHLMGLR